MDKCAASAAVHDRTRSIRSIGLMTTQPEATNDRASDGLLTKRELAARLRKSTRTTDDWMRRGKLPYLKIGKTVLFRWSDVIEKLNSFRVN